MKRGNLIHWILVERKHVPHSKFDAQEKWVPVHECRAAIEPVSGSVTVEGAQVIQIEFIRITFRHVHRSIEAGMRIRRRGLDDKLYNISTVRNLRTHNRWIECQCTEVAISG